jgi:hypothetical protein
MIGGKTEGKGIDAPLYPTEDTVDVWITGAAEKRYRWHNDLLTQWSL